MTENPATVLASFIQQEFPEHELDWDEVERWRAFCDEPEGVYTVTFTKETTEDFDHMERIGAADVAQLRVKNAGYGSSWKRRGGVGAFMMLARKWDRIEQSAKNNGWDIFEALFQDTSDLADDIGDLRRYLLLVEDHVRQAQGSKIHPTTSADRPPVTLLEVKHYMVNRFLMWRLPENFTPDGGISFDRGDLRHPMPTGTNLLDASQARELVDFLLDGAPRG